MAPPQGRMHPSRYLAVLAGIFVVLYALVFFTGPGGVSGFTNWHEKLKPRLGLDLVGGTTVTLNARTPDGKAPSQTSLDEARQIIENRVNGLGVAEPEVVTEGNNQIVVSVAGQNNDAIKQVGAPAQMRFRQVVGEAQDATKAKTPAKPSTGNPSLTNDQRKALLAQVQQKVSPELYQLAGQIQSPDQLQGNAQAAQMLAPFGALSPAEVSVLPAAMQVNIPTISCQQLDNRPAASIDPIDQQVAACDGKTKYLLDKAKVKGQDVKNADFTYDQQKGGWKVTLSFKGKGQDAWTNLTKAAYGKQQPNNQVAITLDNKVVSAPAIDNVITGDAEITGSFSQKDAQLLANQLKYGSLPLTFEQSTAESISATLGTAQLEAGLIAAAIGMLVVVVYALFYYRLLGIVIFLSLVLSGLLVFGTLILLGRQLGLTLTLAGFAGFVVSLGVAADSFVIYFERLKDEIREGRSPRTAVNRAWTRARRTIISANGITIMCAAVLYFLSTGSVKGFAFALGVATLLDLVVVFLFRHPIMTLFARSRAFLSPRVSGLGRVLEQGGGGRPRRGRSSRPAGPSATKEA